MPRTLTAHLFSSVDGAMGRHLMHGHDDVQRSSWSTTRSPSAETCCSPTARTPATDPLTDAGGYGVARSTSRSASRMTTSRRPDSSTTPSATRSARRRLRVSGVVPR